MVMMFLFLISIIFNIILFILVIQYKKEINFLYKIRIGYEKKYNSFKIRYTILSNMEDTLQIIKNLKLIDRPIYIYGNGIIGKKLYNIINGISEIQVIGFIESKDMDKLDQINKEAIVVVTPVFDYDKIVNFLSVQIDRANILCIDEILGELECL